jgi:hypothetical protein
MTDACCDIRVLHSVVQESIEMHIDGDLLCCAYGDGYKGWDPGFAGAVLRFLPQPPPDASTSSRQQQASYDRCHVVKNGLFSHATRVCADAGNALMWCAGDGGRRIKGFRAPDELGGPKNTDVACNRGEDNGMELQYTLQSHGECAGLHVIGSRVLSVTGECVAGNCDAAIR